MHDRGALGPADVSDQRLTGMVAALLDEDPLHLELVSSYAEEVEYDLEAITTAGRWWVRGEARVEGVLHPWALFVKHVQSWSRSPLFRFVPSEHQAVAAASVPWRTEPLVYRSDLRGHLPDGLRMPRAFGVFDLDELSASVWLEVVPTGSVSWDLDRYARAARLLGRLAASREVRALAGVGCHDFDIGEHYLKGRLGLQVIPLLRSEDIWQHPLVAGAFDADLRSRMLTATDRVVDLVEELAAFPRATSHGDACPNNLLCTASSEDFVLIDFGFWQLQPVAFDLSQLLVGDVQLGRRAPAPLAEVDEVIVAAYSEGLHAEGRPLPLDEVRRAHALQLMIFTGLSCLPVEHLDAEPRPELRRVAAQRAALARFSLDLLDATG